MGPVTIINGQELELSYFGNRDYIDVSTIHGAIREAIQARIQSLSPSSGFLFRILRQVSTNGRLYFFEGPLKSAAGRDVDVVFGFQAGATSYHGWLAPGTKAIDARKPEANWDLSKHLSFVSSSVYLKSPFNSDLVYNLMKMGKAVIIHSEIGQNPRVGEFYFEWVPDPNQFSSLSMSLVPLGKRNLYRLVCSQSDRQFGHVTVKVAS